MHPRLYFYCFVYQFKKKSTLRLRSIDKINALSISFKLVHIRNGRVKTIGNFAWNDSNSPGTSKIHRFLARENIGINFSRINISSMRILKLSSLQDTLDILTKIDTSDQCCCEICFIRLTLSPKFYLKFD